MMAQAALAEQAAPAAQAAPTAQNWLLIISEQHRYQGVSYKSDIIVISGTNIT